MKAEGLYYEDGTKRKFEPEDPDRVRRFCRMSAELAIGLYYDENVKEAARKWYFASGSLFSFWFQLGCPRLPLAGMEEGESINYRQP